MLVVQPTHNYFLVCRRVGVCGRVHTHMCVCPFNVCAAACVCMPRVHSTCVFCLVLVGITVHHSGLLQKAISQNFDTFECTQTFMNPFSWKHYIFEHGMAEQVVLAPCIT